MPPKNKKTAAAAVLAVASESEESSEEITANTSNSDAKLNLILSQLANMNKRLDKVDLLSEQLGNIEESMTRLSAENITIRKAVEVNSTAIHSLQQNQNRIDQYNRSWSVRVMELPLSAEEEADPFALVDTVYEKVFLPILAGAREKNIIKRIPSCEQLLERAHVLPALKAGGIKPIICRFLNRDFRAICFRYKKEFAARVAGGGPRSSEGAGGGARYAYPFYEDLTATTFKKLKELQADSRVESCWSINGQLRYRLVNSSEVKRVKQTLDPIDIILK